MNAMDLETFRGGVWGEGSSGNPVLPMRVKSYPNSVPMPVVQNQIFATRTNESCQLCCHSSQTCEREKKNTL